MATIKYRIKGKADPASIYIRLRNGRKTDLEVSTHIKVPVKFWSVIKRQVKTVSDFNHTSINSKLKKLEIHILDQLNADNTNGVFIDNNWLKKSINYYFNRPNDDDEESDIYFIPYIDKLIKNSKHRLTRKGRPLSKKVLQRYDSTKNHIIKYEKFKKIRLRIIDINLIFHTNFINYLTDEIFLNPNTIGRYIDDIKHFCRKAESKGLNVNKEYNHSDFYSPKNDTKDIYLNNEEIEKIYTFDFSSKRLINVRDWLIIGLWTGLRISDFLSLSKKNIEKGYFEILTQKTNSFVIIPIHPNIKSILENRNGNFPNKISHQKFNEYVKDVCKLAGIIEVVEGSKMVKIDTKNGEKSRKTIGMYPKYELVSSHICRRSFATNHYNKLDTLTIMKITGHQTEKQFLNYIKVTPKQHADKLQQYWDNQ